MPCGSPLNTTFGEPEREQEGAVWALYYGISPLQRMEWTTFLWELKEAMLWELMLPISYCNLCCSILIATSRVVLLFLRVERINMKSSIFYCPFLSFMHTVPWNYSAYANAICIKRLLYYLRCSFSGLELHVSCGLTSYDPSTHYRGRKFLQNFSSSRDAWTG